MSNQLEFGVYLRGAETYDDMLRLASASEELGYSGVFLNDHVHAPGGDGKAPYLEAWTAITGIGVQTTKIRLGHITLFNSLRNPAYLAKSIATLDRMTDGRYEIILGAGWNEPEYLGYDLMGEGESMPSPGERVERCIEAVEILRGMLHNPVFNYNGKYWVLDSAINIPQPVQQPFRISVGARSPRLIRLTAKHADGINASGDLNNVENILSSYYPALEKYGKTMDEVYISGFAPSVFLMKDEAEYESTLKKWGETGTDIDAARENSWIGTAEILVEKWRRAMDMGMDMSVINVKPFSTLEENIEQLAYFKDEVSSQL